MTCQSAGFPPSTHHWILHDSGSSRKRKRETELLDNFFHCSVHSELSDGAEITTTKENHGGELVRSCRNGGQENCRGFVISTHVEFVEQPTYWIGFNVLGFGHVETDISELILLWRLHLAIPGNLIEFALYY